MGEGNPTGDFSRRFADPEYTGSFAAFVALIAWAPIPLGSNRPWSSALLAAVALALLGLWLARYALRPFPPRISIYRARWIIVLLTAWACYPVVQLIPLTDDVVALLSPGIHGYFGQISDGASWTARFLTIDPGTTQWAWIRQSSYVAVFLLVIMLVTTAARLRTLLVVIVAVGTFQALYGIVVNLGGENLGLWDPRFSAHAVAGTYVNPNHFAGLMEITLCVAAGLAVAELSRPLASGSSERRFLADPESALVRWVLLGFALLVISSGLLLSASRGALIALMASLLATIALSIWLRGRRAPEARLIPAIAVVAMIATLWAGADTLIEKMQTRGLDSNRSDLRELSYDIVQDNFLFGTGAGTYRWTLPMYKDERFETGFYEHAHNDFLELFGEEGIFGFALFAVGISMVLWRVVIGLSRRRDPLMRGALFAAFSGVLSLLIHGLVSFNLQIPANATYFFLLLGLGLVASELRAGKLS